MTTTTCAISSIRFTVPEFSYLTIQHTAGYFHPIFAASKKDLLRLYRLHTQGQLTATESYLLYLAIANSTGYIIWNMPIVTNPNNPKTIKFLENSIAQLITTINRSESITHPSFEQPKLKITHNCNSLDTIKKWVSTWNENIDLFLDYRADVVTQEQINKAANELLLAIRSPTDTKNYTDLVANWASKAAGFPADKDSLYRDTIRACFNPDKMLNTPIALIKEIREYCETNIEVGSVHFHKLTEVLTAGITNHIEYLGLNHRITGFNLESPSSEATKANTLNKAAIDKISAAAPTKPPVESDFTSKMEFLKAKLAYRVAGSTPLSDRNNTTTSTTKETEL